VTSADTFWGWRCSGKRGRSALPDRQKTNLHRDGVPHGLAGSSTRPAAGTAGGRAASRDTDFVSYHSVPTAVSCPVAVSYTNAAIGLVANYLSSCRYIRYFDRVLRGDKPDLLPKYCQRIMVNTIPDFSDHDAQPEVGGGGCCAELQLLQNGRLLWCSSRQAGSPCKFAPSDGCMSFPVDMELTADVVLRCSHVRAVASGGHQAGQAREFASVPTADVGGTDTHEHLSVNVSGGGEEQQSASDAISGASQFERMPMWRTAFNAGYVQAGLLVSALVSISIHVFDERLTDS
jgi:hypothetical protein